MNFVRFAVGLSSRNFQVKVYCVEGSPIASKLSSTNLKVTYVNKNKKYYDFVNAFRIKKLIKKDNIKAFWLRDTRDISTIGLAKTFSGNKIQIIYQQAMQIGVSKKDFLHTIRFSKIDAWITLLNFLATQVKSQTKFDHKKIHIIPLAVDININDTALISKAKAREQFKLPQDKYVFGIIGRLSAPKGQLFLIKEIAKLRSQNFDIELLIVGEPTRGQDNEYQIELDRTIKELKLSDVVHFHPFLENVEIFYSAIDLFVMASKGETFGNVTIESMAYGVPVLGSNSSGTPEILDFGKLGSLYEVDDENDFNLKANWLLNNLDIIKEKTILAQKVANYKYSREVVFDQMEEVLTKLNLLNCKKK